MKKTLIICALMVLCGSLSAQSVKIYQKHNAFTYNVYEYGDTKDTSKVYLYQVRNEKVKTKGGTGACAYWIESQVPQGTLVPGYGKESTFVDFENDTVVEYLAYSDSVYCCGMKLSRNDIEWKVENLERNRVRYTCSVNSNKLEFVMDETSGRNFSPLSRFGFFKGVLVEFWRNGQLQMELWKAEVRQSEISGIEEKPIRRVTPRQLSALKQQRMVISFRIFDNVQLSWGKENSHIEGDVFENIPFDSVLHFAGGTLALKRMRLPVLPKHYQTFIELHQRSNGDAYDRTGSVFVVPTGYQGDYFLKGIVSHPDSLPTFTGRDGQRYQGMVGVRRDVGEQVWRYQPPVELMRFFTSFGIGHFNDRVQLEGLEWEDENYYKQEVTDLSGYLQGEVWIGVWIGNYDGGGHRVTLDLKSYPGEEIFDGPTSEGDDKLCQPLFNTCNVLEMAGQNYGKLFGTDSLYVDFWIEEGAHQRLRYISTGHGGWGGGDEFNPKSNSILIDGKPAFVYTPWRCDCGRYREWNPVSGNFWNGTSSSDYSRSGWCPGTATQPVYFDLSGLEPGKHTMTIAIPQGEPQEGSFSHWSVSGVIVR